MEQAINQAMAPKRLKAGGRKKPLIITGVVLAVLVAAYAGLCVWAGSLNTFFRGYTINGVDVGGLTMAQAEEKLTETLLTQEIGIYDAEQPESPLLTVTLSDLGLDADALLDTISVSDCFLKDQKKVFFLARGFHFLAGSLSGRHVPYDLSGTDCDQALSDLADQLNQDPLDTSYSLEEATLSIVKAKDGRSVSKADLRQALENADGSPARAELFFAVLPAKTMTAQEIYDETYGEVKNATYDAETDTIVPEQVGADFDVDAAQTALDAAAPGETVTVPAQVQQPTVTAEALKDLLFRDVLGTAQTKVGGTSARKSNVKLSAASIHEFVMNPGDVFSYNEVVGKRTAERGYQPAPAYVQGETVDEIGGGICQTSSTLYLACLRSNLEITERYAHRYIPSYIPAGMDATVSWGGPDFKFTNNTDYPIKIVATYANSTLTVKILGTNIDGTYAKITNEYLSTTPYEVIYEDDPTLAPGTEKVKTTPYTGYKYRTYRNVYAADGTLISSEYEATSDYKSRNKVILRGPALPETPATDPGTGTATDPGTGTSTDSGTGTATDPGTTTNPDTSTSGSGTIVIVPDTGTDSGTGTTGDDNGGLPPDVRPEDEPFL